MIVTKKIESDFDWNARCLVPVRLLTEGKGKITNLALICLPKSDDYIGNSSKSLVEPLKKDKNEKYRKILRTGHKVLLKRLRRAAVRRRRKILVT
jgi:hypothetical protein